MTYYMRMISLYPWICSVGWCLAEISTEIQEAVAYWRRVRDDALYRSTFTLLYLLDFYFVGKFIIHQTIHRPGPRDTDKLEVRRDTGLYGMG